MMDSSIFEPAFNDNNGVEGFYVRYVPYSLPGPKALSFLCGVRVPQNGRRRRRKRMDARRQKFAIND